MSFAQYKKVISYGDTIVLYLGFDNLLQFEITKGKIHQTKYGAIKHDDLVGQKFGKKFQLSRGYVYVLHPSPELWTVTLRHRTQILYSTDISLIVYQLDLKPGAVVIESGTGSASLSHALLRTIYPSGHLHTFDFHSVRAELALDEFKRHGFDSSVVTVKHQDVCEKGFDIKNAADAVFLDLPKPWLAVPFAKESLIPGGRICSFSPCIEQVQKCCEALRKCGFTEIETWECLTRPQEVRTMSLPLVGVSLEEQDQKGTFKPTFGRIEYESESKNKTSQTKANSQTKPSNKKQKLDTKASTIPPPEHLDSNKTAVDSPSIEQGSSALKECKAGKEIKGNLVFKACMPSLYMAGHTGYLTFATLYPN